MSNTQNHKYACAVYFLFCTVICRHCTATTWKCQRGCKQATTKFSFWSGYDYQEFNPRRVRQHLTKWVSWNNRDEDWNNSNSPFYATFILPSLSADFKVSIKINFYGKERFFTKAINLSLWLEIFKRINNRRGTRKTFMSRAKRRFLFFHSVSRLRGQGRTISIELKDKSIALAHLIWIIRKLN